MLSFTYDNLMLIYGRQVFSILPLNDKALQFKTKIPFLVHLKTIQVSQNLLLQRKNNPIHLHLYSPIHLHQTSNVSKITQNENDLFLIFIIQIHFSPSKISVYSFKAFCWSKHVQKSWQTYIFIRSDFFSLWYNILS